MCDNLTIYQVAEFRCLGKFVFSFKEKHPCDIDFGKNTGINLLDEHVVENNTIRKTSAVKSVLLIQEEINDRFIQHYMDAHVYSWEK